VFLRIKNDVAAIAAKVENRFKITKSELKEKLREEEEPENETETEPELKRNLILML